MVNVNAAVTTLLGVPGPTTTAALETILVLLSAVVLTLALAMTYAVHVRAKAGAKHVDVKDLQAMKVPRDSLFRVFQPHLVPMSQIGARGYACVLAIVQEMIGVQPTCDMVLEIWKPAFECYNLIVPNFLNCPQLLLPGYGIRDLVSLAMYISSRANNCTYCTSHCCSFALRRGVDPSILRHALDALLDCGSDTVFTPRERAVIRVAYGLGTVPASLQTDDVEAMEETLIPEEVEWIVASTAMFGSFNKLMDGLAIPLESDTYAETQQHMDYQFVPSKPASIGLDANVNNDNSLPVPPVDDWTLVLAVIWQGIRPGGAIALDAKLAEGVPTKAEECISYLQDLTGVHFSVLGNLQHDRFRRGLTAILAKNLVSDGISLRTKALAGIQYAQLLHNQQLQSEMQVLLSNLDARGEDPNEELTLRVAKALSYNPSRMTEALIDEVDTSTLTAENLVELVSFLAALQALHRVEAYYLVAGR